MAASRESINRIKIEDFRVSGVPINPDTTIYQGDLLVWDDGARRAVPHPGSASGGNFYGIAEGKNPTDAVGVLSEDFESDRINVIQEALVELIVDESATFYIGDRLTIGTTSVQHVKKTGATAANQVGVVAPENKWTTAGKALVTGDVILLWLRVPAAYKQK